MIHLLIKKDYHTFNCPSFFNFNLLILGWSLSIFPRSPLTRPYTTTTIITTIWNEISFVWSTLSILRYDRLPSFDKLIIISILKKKNLIFSILIKSSRVEKEGKRRDRTIFMPFYRRQPNHCSQPRYRLLLIRVRVISVRLGRSLQRSKRSQWPVLARVVTLSASFLVRPWKLGRRAAFDRFLVSLGTTTVSFVFRCRRSSQAGMDMTKHLWRDIVRFVGDAWQVSLLIYVQRDCTSLCPEKEFYLEIHRVDGIEFFEDN